MTIPLEFGMCFPSSCDVKDFYSLLYVNWDGILCNKSLTDVNTMNYTVTVLPPVEQEEPKCPWI